MSQGLADRRNLNVAALYRRVEKLSRKHQPPRTGVAGVEDGVGGVRARRALLAGDEVGRHAGRGAVHDEVDDLQGHLGSPLVSRDAKLSGHHSIIFGWKMQTELLRRKCA